MKTKKKLLILSGIGIVFLIAIFYYSYSGWIGIPATNFQYYWNKGEALKSTWIQDKDNYVYLGADGHITKGFAQINCSKYYFSEDTGIMQTGWLSINEKTFFANTDGKLAAGMQEVDNKTYIFTNKGELIEGWILYESKSYYQTTNGIISGWHDISSKKHYFNDDGTVHTGWLNYNHDLYYFTKNGTMLTGDFYLEGNYYHFGKDGKACTGWLNNKYYQSNGTAAAGLFEIDGNVYYFNEKGEKQTGLITVNDNKYYFTENGTAKTGWHEIDGSKIFTCNDGYVLDTDKEQGNYGKLIIRKADIEVNLYKAKTRDDYQLITDNYNSALVVKERSDQEPVIADRKSQGFNIDVVEEGDIAYILEGDEIKEYIASKISLGKNIKTDVVDENNNSIWKQNKNGFCTYVTAGTINKEDVIVVFWEPVLE